MSQKTETNQNPEVDAALKQEVTTDLEGYMLVLDQESKYGVPEQAAWEVVEKIAQERTGKTLETKTGSTEVKESGNKFPLELLTHRITEENIQELIDWAKNNPDQSPGTYEWLFVNSGEYIDAIPQNQIENISYDTVSKSVKVKLIPDMVGSEDKPEYVFSFSKKDTENWLSLAESVGSLETVLVNQKYLESKIQEAEGIIKALTDSPSDQEILNLNKQLDSVEADSRFAQFPEHDLKNFLRQPGVSESVGNVHIVSDRYNSIVKRSMALLKSFEEKINKAREIVYYSGSLHSNSTPEAIKAAVDSRQAIIAGSEETNNESWAGRIANFENGVSYRSPITKQERILQPQRIYLYKYNPVAAPKPERKKLSWER